MAWVRERNPKRKETVDPNESFRNALEYFSCQPAPKAKAIDRTKISEHHPKFSNVMVERPLKKHQEEEEEEERANHRTVDHHTIDQQEEEYEERVHQRAAIHHKRNQPRRVSRERPMPKARQGATLRPLPSHQSHGTTGLAKKASSRWSNATTPLQM